MSVSSTNNTRSNKSNAASNAASTSSPTKRTKSQTTIDDDDAELQLERNRKTPRTPTKTSLSSNAAATVVTNNPKIVTPSSNLKVAVERSSGKKAEKSSTARRVLGIVDEEGGGADYKNENNNQEDNDDVVIVAKKKLPFGATKEPISIPLNVQAVYSIIQKYTGSIGGNGNGGAIYGELTAGSMQKMINLMVKHTGFSRDSRFIDVGCGLAKPNLHVAQYPGVEFSYGIEVEHVRYMLGMANLEQVLKAALKDEVYGEEESEEFKAEIGHKCILSYGDITEAKSFDPFTHVYMFDVGMPPILFHQMSEMFNKSQAEYLICYHGPKTMIEDYGFNIELIVQTSTYMTASTECHEGYIYRHTDIPPIKASARNTKNFTFGIPCDPRFSDAWKQCGAGLENLYKYVAGEVQKEWGVSNKRVTRSAARARENN